MSSQFLFAAGSNAHGQLATGSCDDAHIFTASTFVGHPPGALPSGTTLLQIACGANHTLALLASPEGTALWGAGDRRRGQLGTAHTVDTQGASCSTTVFRPLVLEPFGLPGYTVRRIAAGWETSYVVLAHAGHSDVLLSMGADDFGDRGAGTAGGRGPLHAVALDRLVGGPFAVGFLAAGPHHVVVGLKEAGTVGVVAGWGASRHGQLGVMPGASTRPPAFCASPRLIALPAEPQVPSAVQCAALGNQHTVLLHSSGRLAGLGAHRKGQLSGLDALADVRAVGCTWNGTYALVQPAGADAWRVLATGSHARGQLGRPLDADAGGLAEVRFPFSLASQRFEKMACGSEHVLCLVARGGDREVWGWGWNEHGNMGVGATEDVPLPVRLWPPSGRECEGRAVDVWCGCGTSWIVVER